LERFVIDLKIRGIGRDPADPSGRTLLLFLNRKPTDGELRAIHDQMAVEELSPMERRRDRH
jgi:hypothetical protein